MGLFLALKDRIISSITFWDKNQLKEMDDYIIKNDIEHILESYEKENNEYIREIIRLKYEEKMKYDEIALCVPYSRQRINEIVIDFKKYTLYKIKDQN